MKKIIKLEFIKTLNYAGFRTIIILHAVLFLLVVIVSSQYKLPLQTMFGAKSQVPLSEFGLSKLFAFPYVWSSLSWIASWFNLLLGILAIMLIGNEFQFRTFRKQILDGVGRHQLLYAKIIVLLTLALYAFLIVLITSFAFGFIYSDNITFSSVFEKFPYVLVFFIQALAYMMLGMLFAMLLKNNSLSIVAYMLFFFIGEPIIRAFIPDTIDKFFPVKIISNLTPMPDFLDIATHDMIQINGKSPLSLKSMGLIPESTTIWVSTIVCIAYITIFYFATKRSIERKNF